MSTPPSKYQLTQRLRHAAGAVFDNGDDGEEMCLVLCTDIRAAADWLTGVTPETYIQPPCPPTREALIEHYARCIAASEIPEHRAEFLAELLKELHRE